MKLLNTPVKNETEKNTNAIKMLAGFFEDVHLITKLQNQRINRLEAIIDQFALIDSRVYKIVEDIDKKKT